jgi:hypothetical protein
LVVIRIYVNDDMEGTRMRVLVAAKEITEHIEVISSLPPEPFDERAALPLLIDHGLVLRGAALDEYIHDTFKGIDLLYGLTGAPQERAQIRFAVQSIVEAGQSDNPRLLMERVSDLEELYSSAKKVRPFLLESLRPSALDVATYALLIEVDARRLWDSKKSPFKHYYHNLCKRWPMPVKTTRVRWYGTA